MESFEALQTIPYSKSLPMSLRACGVFVYHFLHGVFEALCEVSIGRGPPWKVGEVHHPSSREEIRLIFGLVGKFSPYLVVIIKICNKKDSRNFHFSEHIQNDSWDKIFNWIMGKVIKFPNSKSHDFSAVLKCRELELHWSK